MRKCLISASCSSSKCRWSVNCLSREEIQCTETPSTQPWRWRLGETTAELLDACCRLVDLLNTPQDIPFLSGLIQREIIYRILRGPEGARLRAIATLGDQSHRTAKAIAWIRTNYAKPLRVEDLAQIAGMGLSTLHHHFRALTAMSPLQYQKQLRLQAARGRMLDRWSGCSQRGIRSRIRKREPIQSRIQPVLRPTTMRDIRTLRSPTRPRWKQSVKGREQGFRAELRWRRRNNKD